MHLVPQVCPTVLRLQNPESIDGSPATYCTKASFFLNEEIDIFDDEMVAWAAPTEKKVNRPQPWHLVKVAEPAARVLDVSLQKRRD